jgi:undecaprenyl-diphosphatase
VNYSQAGLLGLVQGFGEFLPISSSAHLALAPWLLRFQDPGLTFDVALHVGTLAAITAAFGARWWSILAGTVRNWRGPEANKIKLIIIATVPAVILGLLFEKKAETIFRDPRLIAAALIIGAPIMELADRVGPKNREWQGSSWLSALLIGMAQAMAIVPGVSRSGATMSAGLALGYTRESAAELSFLMSAPIIAGAAVLKLRHLVLSDLTPPFIWGVLISAVSGWFAVKVFLSWLSRYGLKPYVYYRIILGLVVLTVYWARS